MTVDCDRARSLLPAYLDGEVELPPALELEEHVASCARCSGLRDETIALGKRVRSAAPYHRAPTALRDSIRQEIAAASPNQRHRWRRLAWPTAAAACLAFLLFGYFLGQHGRLGSDQPVLAAELVAAHVRSLQADHLVDVASSDHHTVAPWFTGRIDFAPVVVDHADIGFPLEGGRVDYLHGRNVAALVYRHDKHRINVFVWPAESGPRDIEPSASKQQGFTLVNWRAAGMDYAAASDASPQTLATLVKALRDQGR